MTAPIAPIIRPGMSPAVSQLLANPTVDILAAPMKDVMDFQRRAAAYHEAGHAIVAFECGHWISPEGVEIDERQYCGHRCLVVNHNSDNTILIALAGWLSEHRFHGRGHARESDEPEEFEYVLDLIRSDNEEDLEEAGDLGIVAEVLLSEAGEGEGDDVLLARLRDYESKVVGIISVVSPGVV